jgi:hypothetical protein
MNCRTTDIDARCASVTFARVVPTLWIGMNGALHHSPGEGCGESS